MRPMAAPDSSDDAGSPASGKERQPNKAAFGAIRTLRVLLVGTIIVPLLLGAVGGYLSYRASSATAAAALAEAVAVAGENTTKILDTHVLVAARIDDLLGRLAGTDVNLGVRSGRQAVDEGARQLIERGVLVSVRQRLRVRDRIVLRYYARTIAHLLAPSRRAVH